MTLSLIPTISRKKIVTWGPSPEKGYDKEVNLPYKGCLQAICPELAGQQCNPGSIDKLNPTKFLPARLDYETCKALGKGPSEHTQDPISIDLQTAVC